MTKIKCLWCGDIIESKVLHDMKFCKCGKTGLDYHPVWERISYEPKKDSKMFEIVDDNTK